MPKKVKRLLIILIVMSLLTLLFYVSCYIYDRYNSGYSYSSYNQLEFCGGYNNCQLKFYSCRFSFDGRHYSEKGKIYSSKYKLEDISLKIEGRWYNLAELTLDKIKQFKNSYQSISSYSSEPNYSIIYTSFNRDKIYGDIDFDFKKGKIKYLDISGGGNSGFNPEIKIKGKGIVKFPISLSELQLIFPEIKYHSRTYIDFDERLRRWFFTK